MEVHDGDRGGYFSGTFKKDGQECVVGTGPRVGQLLQSQVVMQSVVCIQILYAKSIIIERIFCTGDQGDNNRLQQESKTVAFIKERVMPEVASVEMGRFMEQVERRVNYA